MPLTVPTAAGQRQKIGTQDYISVVDGDRLVLTKVAPDPIDLSPLEKRITDLATNEAADDKTVEALDALVKAIDLTPYAKTADLPAPVDLKPLGDRITTIENKPVITTDTVISDNDPDNSEWKNWFKRLYDWNAWTMAVVHFVRVAPDWAWPMNSPEYRTMPPATHANAIQVSPGNFTNRLQGGATFAYSTTRNSSNDSIEFLAGVYTAIQWEYREANGDLIAASARYETIGVTDTAHGMGRDSAPTNAATVAIILIKPDNSQVRYRFDLV